MTLAQKLQEDFRKYDIEAEVRIEELNSLGYLLTEREINIGTPITFKLVEVVDEDKKRVCSFSYLFHVKPNIGYIMPRTFNEYNLFTQKNYTSADKVAI